MAIRRCIILQRQAKQQVNADSNIRLGFSVYNFDVIVASLGENIVSAPQQTEWGYMAILQDPDGRKVEVYKNNFIVRNRTAAVIHASQP